MVNSHMVHAFRFQLAFATCFDHEEMFPKLNSLAQSHTVVHSNTIETGRSVVG